ncbi:glycine/D-amino acid oxidase-like deaminating enzyme [Dyadobacter jejuensis]|uniref:Glycine/D-amino acid oxidase-like deaminating enzyme n=1 Tax=Dyadobacter jejuensis TaxID=1082580 RepID=A0A316AKV7_9BACT|nr:FAD-dependent oxidoreductase [Dyadobacter jejuensis]PWJ58403.1 glycine/D-amino acid oxidase-like deaminating enzyme [Dyadobacter jejuensis]
MEEQAVDYDYLIVGQGIGGTTLAWTLLERGKRILIVDLPALPASSLVAAGIFNPLTGKKLVKTWMADTIFPYASTFYGEIEKKLNVSFLHHLPFIRPYRSIEEQNSYLAQSADPALASYVGEPLVAEEVVPYIKAPHGGLHIVRSGWVDLPIFIAESRHYFQQHQCFRAEGFDANDLQPEAECIQWKGLRFGKVILSQGALGQHDRYFNWLPFTPVKGEILEVQTQEKLNPYMVNQGIFLLPTSANYCKVGATYAWDPLDWESTTSAREELEGKLSSLLKGQFTTITQKAGIRPSVRDRRPLVGRHPDLDRLCIFNGLGTKGVTLAPYFANEFVEHLENGKELNSFVNIKRYFSLYFR